MMHYLTKYLGLSKKTAEYHMVTDKYEEVKGVLARHAQIVRLKVPHLITPVRIWTLIEVLDDLTFKNVILFAHLSGPIMKAITENRTGPTGNKRARVDDSALVAIDESRLWGDIEDAELVRAADRVHEDYPQGDPFTIDASKAQATMILDSGKGIREAIVSNELLGTIKALSAKIETQKGQISRLQAQVVKSDTSHKNELKKLKSELSNAYSKEIAVVCDELSSMKGMMAAILTNVSPLCMRCCLEGHKESECKWIRLICENCGKIGHATTLHSIKDKVLQSRISCSQFLKFNTTDPYFYI